MRNAKLASVVWARLAIHSRAEVFYGPKNFMGDLASSPNGLLLPPVPDGRGIATATSAAAGGLWARNGNAKTQKVTLLLRRWLLYFV